MTRRVTLAFRKKKYTKRSQLVPTSLQGETWLFRRAYDEAALRRMSTWILLSEHVILKLATAKKTYFQRQTVGKLVYLAIL